MATKLSFLKVIPIRYISGTDTLSSITRTFTDTIESDDAISVSINGQIIPKHTAESLTSFAKFYWEVSGTGLSSTSTTITIKANQVYHNSAYTSGSTIAYSFSASDIIYIEYTYTLEM